MDFFSIMAFGIFVLLCTMEEENKICFAPESKIPEMLEKSKSKNETTEVSAETTSKDEKYPSK